MYTFTMKYKKIIRDLLIQSTREFSDILAKKDVLFNIKEEHTHIFLIHNIHSRFKQKI